MIRPELLKQAQPTRLKVVVLCLFFCLVQFSTLQHEIQHYFHDHLASCDGFIASASSGVACDNAIYPGVAIAAVPIPQQKPFAALIADAYPFAPIRAPPVDRRT